MNHSPEEGSQNPPSQASPSQRLVEFFVQRGIGSAKSPVATMLLIAAIGSLSAFGALTIFYQIAIHFIHPDTALWLCVAIPCAAPFVFALTRRNSAVVQAPLSDEPKATRRWTTAKPWIALVLSIVVGVPVVFALRPLISTTSNDEMDRQAGRILICIVLCIHYLAAWMLLCWLGRYFKLQTQPREESSPDAESPWQSDWKSAPWWAIGFCAAALLIPRSDNAQPGARDRSASSASANFVVQRNQQRLATVTYWQTAVANLHAIRFETPSGKESFEKYQERMFQQLRSLTSTARSTSTANVDAELLQMATRHLSVDEQYLELKTKMDKLMQQERLPSPKDSVDQRMELTQVILNLLATNPEAVEALPAGPERDLVEKGLELEQTRQEQYREIEIMQATLQERYKGTAFPLPTINQP